jgi:TonB family protein
MKLFFTSLFLLTASICFAQKQNVYFLKNDGKYVDVRDSADYIRIVREPDSASVLYNVFEFYLNNQKKSIGKSTTVDPPKYDGMYLAYYKNGKRESFVNYKNGIKTGDDFEYFPNGKPYLELNYIDYSYTPSSRIEAGCLIKTCNDSLGNAMVINGNGYFKGYNDDFTYIEEEGNIKEGRRDGQWKGENKALQITFTENYDNEKLLNGRAIDKDGKIFTYTKSRYTIPEFKGGLEVFGNYLARSIRYPQQAREKRIQGRVIITFIVEKNGSLSDFRILRSVEPSLDAEALRVLKISPQWIPGTQFGKPVRVQYSVPIGFSLAD